MNVSYLIFLVANILRDIRWCRRGTLGSPKKVKEFVSNFYIKFLAYNQSSSNYFAIDKRDITDIA